MILHMKNVSGIKQDNQSGEIVYIDFDREH